MPRQPPQTTPDDALSIRVLRGYDVASLLNLDQETRRARTAYASMAELIDDEELYPDELLSEVARRLGFGELFDDVVGLTSA